MYLRNGKEKQYIMVVLNCNYHGHELLDLCNVYQNNNIHSVNALPFISTIVVYAIMKIN